MRQRLLRRPEAEPTVHGREPVALLGFHGDDRGAHRMKLSVFLRPDRQIVAIAPLFPRAVVVPQIVVADQMQRK